MTPNWIAVDWGTTNLRVWAIGKEDQVLAQANSDRGMGGLKQEEFEPVLMELVARWLKPDEVMNVIACGMVGARQGWVEAPYGLVPCEPIAGENAISFTSQDERLRLHIVAGLRQDNPADVMRGEETQIAGLLYSEPNFEGMVCLPGTHTKWVKIERGRIINFSTHLTGEMFSLLAEKSVLRHTVSSDGWDEEEFKNTFETALEKPDKISASLFSIRAEALIGDLQPEAARSRLSALLLALEFSGIRDERRDQKVAIIGSDGLAKIYEQALFTLGLTPVLLDADTLTLAGLSNAHRKIILGV